MQTMPIIIVKQNGKHITATGEGVEYPEADVALLIIERIKSCTVNRYQVMIGDQIHNIKSINWTQLDFTNPNAPPIIEIELI